MSNFWFEIDLVTGARNHKGNYWLVYRICSKEHIAWSEYLPCSEDMAHRMRKARLPLKLSQKRAKEKCNYFNVDPEIRALINV